jgi:hypothetical protein
MLKLQYCLGCACILEPVVRIDGRGAQRETVEDMFILALMRSSTAATAQAVLERRFHCRPLPRDLHWSSLLST